MRRKNFYILVSVFYFLLFLLPSLGFAQTKNFWKMEYLGGPLVSCTGNYGPSNTSPTGQKSCTNLCDLIETFINVIYFGMSLVVFIFTPIFFAWGGIMILVAGGDPGKLQSGKKILTGTLWGLGITLGAFLIVSTFIKVLGVSKFIPGFDSAAINCKKPDQ